MRPLAPQTAPPLHLVDAQGQVLFTASTWSDQLEALTAALAVRGVGPGDRVLAWLPRGPEEQLLCAATHQRQAVWASIPRRSTPSQVDALVADAAPKVAITLATDLPRLRPGPWLAWSALAAPASAAPATGCALAPFPPAALSALCYTSGSTGQPKAVMVAERHLTSGMARIDAYLRHRASDRILAVLAPHAPWSLILTRLVRQVGATLVLPPSLATGAELVACIDRLAVTGLAALPLTWIQIVDTLLDQGASLPSLRYVTCSGGLIPPRILAAFPRVFPAAELWLTYGLTEAFRTTLVPHGEFTRRHGSLGRPCPDVEIQVIRPDGSRTDDNEVGELIHRGEVVTLGYWQRPAAHARAFTVQPAHRAHLPPGPIHYSGDLVRRDAEGYLWFVGRADTLIKTAGYRVSPDEVEAALLAVPGVRQAIVVGVPDPQLGQRVAAALELDLAHPAAELRTSLRQHLRLHLSSHQHPSPLLVWPGLFPHTPTGKIDRAAILQKLAAAADSASSSAASPA
jgi:acyl-coenzyme A synthetase/AMP-(fatty) acid ligase